MSTGRTPAIDTVCNLFTPEVVRSRPSWTREFIGEKVKGRDRLPGVTVSEMLAKMDRAGVERAILLAVRLGVPGSSEYWELAYEEVARVVAEHPGRFHGLAGINPTEGRRGVERLERAVTELGFVGAHLYPHWFDRPPDDRIYYPFYAKCVELGVPIQMQVGHVLPYSKHQPIRSVGRPIALDTIACHFPELTIVGSHTGYPWTEEMLSVAWKHPNVFVSSDAYAPKYWSAAFVRFINTFGQDKVIFGTDFPVIDVERAIREVEELGLRPAAMRKFLRENALRVYKLG